MRWPSSAKGGTVLGDYYNLVRRTSPLQRSSGIPGLERPIPPLQPHASEHLCSPAVLAEDLSLKAAPNLYIAGQLSGVEGYVESAAMGIEAALNFWRKKEGKAFLPPARNHFRGFDPLHPDFAQSVFRTYERQLGFNDRERGEETIMKSTGAIDPIGRWRMNKPEREYLDYLRNTRILPSYSHSYHRSFLRLHR